MILTNVRKTNKTEFIRLMEINGLTNTTTALLLELNNKTVQSYCKENGNEVSLTTLWALKYAIQNDLHLKVIEENNDSGQKKK